MIYGLELDAFWRSSIKTIELVLAAKAAALREDYNRQIIIAYKQAGLMRAKRMPRLETLLMREEKRQHKQTWQESFELMKRWEFAQMRRKAAEAAAKGK